MTSVACEKQVSVLAEHLDRVLDEVLRRSAGEVDVPPASSRRAIPTLWMRRSPRNSGRHHDHRLGSEHDRIVIELFSNVDVGEGERGNHRRQPRRPTARSRPTSSWSRSPPRTRGTSWPAPKPWWLLAGHHVRSVCSRSTRMGTSAPGQRLPSAAVRLIPL